MSCAAGPDIKEDGLVLALDVANRKTFANSVINSTSWSLGSGSATGYSQNGATVENERVTGTDPFGRSATVWETRPTGTTDADGGWNSDWFNIDSTKLHRFSVWVKRTTDTSGGTFYFGLYGNNGIRRTDNNAVEGNPYWDCRGTGGFVKDVWYLVTGHCYPYNTIYTGQHPESGIYTVAGGTTKVASIDACNIGADVKWAGIDVTQTIHRCYHYYCADSTTRLQLFDPRIDVIGGTEPSIANLLSGFTANRLTDLIGTNNGTFVNGPTYNSANGGSLSFDGTNDYVDCVLNSGLTGTGSWTMSAWFKINGAPSAGLYQNAIVDTDATGGSANMICTDWSGWHGGSQNQLLYASRPSTGGSYTNLLGPVLTQGIWYNATVVRNGTTDTKLYTNGSLSATYTGNIPTATQPLVRIGRWTDGTNYANCNISQVQIHNRALTAQEVQQNYNALKGRFTPEYVTLTYTASGNLTVTGNGTNTVNIFKTSGGNGWDNQAYSLVPFTAPCTIEFNKQAVSGDNGDSYAMIGWNADPTTDASYSSIDYASYPYRTDSYVVYHNGSLVHNSGSWSTSSKFYIVYGTDGVMRHYNGSTLLYSVNYGTGNTVYVDSSFYSPNATFGGFSNIKVIRSAWNGTNYG